MRRTFVAIGLVAVMGLAGAASAESLDGGCSVNATSDLNETHDDPCHQGQPFDVDPEGSIS
jgi:hypothetical protein